MCHRHVVGVKSHRTPSDPPERNARGHVQNGLRNATYGSTRGADVVKGRLTDGDVFACAGPTAECLRGLDLRQSVCVGLTSGGVFVCA